MSSDSIVYPSFRSHRTPSLELPGGITLCSYQFSSFIALVAIGDPREVVGMMVSLRYIPFINQLPSTQEITMAFGSREDLVNLDNTSFVLITQMDLGIGLLAVDRLVGVHHVDEQYCPRDDVHLHKLS